MTRLDFWFDPISPFAYLAFERLPQALEGVGHVVHYRPVLFAGLLNHHGHKGPAEIEPKRAWTFRHVAWLAHHHGIPMQRPLAHPFNPLPLLRLLVACAPEKLNRLAVEAVFHHVWRSDGADASDPARLAALAARLQPARDPAGEDVKRELREATDAAIAAGVFGVPTFGIAAKDGGERLFWGVDALPMLRAAIEGDPWFDGPTWATAGAKPAGGITRRSAPAAPPPGASPAPPPAA